MNNINTTTVLDVNNINTTTVLDMNNINTTTVLDMNNINTTTVLDMNNINTTTVLDMNNINTTYSIGYEQHQYNLHQFTSNCESIKPNYKTYLKQLSKDNIAQVEFIKPNRKNCLEKLCSSSEKDRIVDSVLESTTDIYDQIYETAMLIRNNEKEQKPWKFQGSFEDYQETDMLHALIKWIITGPKTTLNSEKRQHYLDRTVNNVTQIISQSIKSDRQIKYSSTSSKSATFHETKETPFSVGLGLLMYKYTRSKNIINILPDETRNQL